MTTPTEETTNTRPAAEAHAAQSHEVTEALALLKRHGVPVAIGVGAALAIALVAMFVRGRIDASRRDAAMLFASSRSLGDLERVVNDYGSSPSAPLALLRLAQAQFDTENYTAAAQSYDRFLASFGEHPMAAAAELGKVHTLEAQGRIEEALAGFNDFAARHPDHFLTPQAILGKGRCLELLGRITEARITYESFIADSPPSGWTRRADERLEDLARGVTASLSAPATQTALPAGPFIPVELPATPTAPDQD
jgi:TolA-binding protein